MTSAANSDFLQAMAASSRARFIAAEKITGEAQLQEQLSSVRQPVPLTLSEQGFDLIAEVKRRSPAEGELGGHLKSPEAQAHQYIEGGAAAISVLTEPDRFAGSLNDLTQVVNASPTTPVMRKDFLVESYQITEARLAGASGVLLIAAILESSKLEQMLATAAKLQMFVLLEVFGRDDLAIAVSALERSHVEHSDAQVLLGVNCRDLRNLQVDFDNFESLAPHLPKQYPWVAESGLKTAAQAGQLAAMGYRLALAGTTLMKSTDPKQTVTDLINAGRT